MWGKQKRNIIFGIQYSQFENEINMPNQVQKVLF